MSTLYVDNLQPNLGSRVMAAGHVVQVVQGTLGSTATGTTSGNTFYDCGLSATITPTSSSSKILISYTIHMGTGSYQAKSRIVRDSTVVGIGTQEGSRTGASSVSNFYDDNGTTMQYQYQPQGITYLDSPASSSALTYKIQVSTYHTVFWSVNRGYTFQQDTTYGAYDAIPLSVITLMEIAQ